MPNEDINLAPNAIGPDTIDVQSDDALATWARRLDASPEQVKDAVAAVGDRAADVELHLKGSRSSTNAATADRAETPTARTPRS